MAQLTERLGLDLPDALAGDLEVLADLLEGVVGLLTDAEPHAQDLLLTWRQGRQDLAGLVGEIYRDDALARRDDRLVLDEVAQVRVLFLADRGLERDRLLGDLEDLADLVERQLHALGDLLGDRLPAPPPRPGGGGGGPAAFWVWPMWRGGGGGGAGGG